MATAKLLAVVLGSAAVFLAVWHYLKPRRIPVAEEWKARLGAAGRGARLAYFLFGAAACAAAAYAVTGQAHLAALATPGGAWVAKRLEARKEAARRELLRSQYAAVLESLVSGLQGGLSPYQALEDAVPSMPMPAREVFAAILARTRTGETFVQAAEEAARETGWRDLESLVVALRIYGRTGCNLAEVFRHLLETIYERENDRRYVAAVTAEPRITAAVLSFLPFFLMGVSRALAPEFSAPLFTTLAGNAVIGLCVLMVAAGNAVIRKMVKGVAGDA